MSIIAAYAARRCGDA